MTATPPAEQEQTSAFVRGYAICTAPRSGSSWLCELLSSTRELGDPKEYFNVVGRRLVEPDYPADPGALFERVLGDGRSRNGVYGVKVFPRHLDALGRQARWRDHLPNLRLVRWRRRDLLGQALSRARVLQTRRWSASLADLQPAEYDGQAILESLGWLATQNARWDIFFGRNGLPGLSLCYEDTLQDPQSAVDAFADMMGVSPRPSITAANLDLKIQRDHVSAEWRQRFADDYGDINYVDELPKTA